MTLQSRRSESAARAKALRTHTGHTHRATKSRARSIGYESSARVRVPRGNTRDGEQQVQCCNVANSRPRAGLSASRLRSSRESVCPTCVRPNRGRVTARARRNCGEADGTRTRSSAPARRAQRPSLTLEAGANHWIKQAALQASGRPGSPKGSRKTRSSPTARRRYRRCDAAENRAAIVPAVCRRAVEIAITRPVSSESVAAQRARHPRPCHRGARSRVRPQRAHS